MCVWEEGVGNAGDGSREKNVCPGIVKVGVLSTFPQFTCSRVQTNDKLIRGSGQLNVKYSAFFYDS